MYKKVLFIAAVFMLFCAYSYAADQMPQQVEVTTAPQQVEAPAVAQIAGIPTEKIVEIATMAVKAKGVQLDEVNIIYDEGNKLWSEKLGVLTELDTNPNHGVLKRGFLKNYYTVYFDFKEPLKDIWVFIDKDTGEVFEVYAEQ
jgi:hypothetical protein